MDGPHSVIWRRLRKSGLLPQHSVGDPPHLATGADLLPLLRLAWASCSNSERSASARRWQQRLIGDQSSPPHLTYGFPGPTGDLIRSWIGERLVWWPHDIASRPWLGIVSSRLGRPLYEHSTWFAKLRTACQIAQANSNTLVFAANTTTARYLDRCGRLYKIPTLRLEVARENQPFERWLKGLAESQPPQSVEHQQHSAYVSPTLNDSQPTLAPVRDALAIAASDQLVALQVRASGNIEHLLSRRGGLGTSPHLFHVARPSAATKEPKAEKRYAIPPGISKTAPIIRADQIPDGWLLHWTRQHDEPWPDESLDQYLDSLILHKPEADHSALATLRRIAVQQRLVATAKAIRGSYSVVCFSAASVLQLSEKRIYRPHRGRWDFEPFGVCIERKWLEAIDTRPVVYGDDSLWQSMTKRERPFFQQRKTSRVQGIDWTLEHEWRHVGDVDLSTLSPQTAALFVPQNADAEEMREISRWPIVVLNAS